MTTTQSPCWRPARPCPPSGSDFDQSVVCEAWYQCDPSGDYIIRWRCQSEGVVNKTTPPTLLCDRQEDDVCPPPAVCPDFLPEPARRAAPHEDPSLDLVLVIGVATFALLAIGLIGVSTYRYWTLRRRLRMAANSKGRSYREFPHPVRYHSPWNGALYGDSWLRGTQLWNHHTPDVYYSHPAPAPWPYCQSNEVSSPSDSSLDHLVPPSMSPYHSPRSQTRCSRLGIEPSVVTGSFVFQPSREQGEKTNQSRGRSHVPSTSTPDPKWGHRGYYFYKGNLSSASDKERKRDEARETKPHKHVYQKNQHLQQKSNRGKKEATTLLSPEKLHVSSIPIPAFDGYHRESRPIPRHDTLDSSTMNSRYMYKKIVSSSSPSSEFESLDESRSTPSPWHDEMMTYTARHASHMPSHCTPNGDIAQHGRSVQNGGYTPNGGITQHGRSVQNGGYTPNGGITQHGRSAQKGGYTPTGGNIQNVGQTQNGRSTHYEGYTPNGGNELTRNCGRILAHIEQHDRMNVHGKETASDNTRTPVSLTPSHFLGETTELYAPGANSSINTVNFSAATSVIREEVTSGDKSRPLEVSYDSFRNDHLRDVALHGLASSSTLDGGFRQVVAKVGQRY